MKYVIIADEVAHGLTAVLDAAAHPQETKEKVEELKTTLKELPRFTLEEMKGNLNKLFNEPLQ